MWIAFKNFKAKTVHAVSLPAGMTPHGFAGNWPLEAVHEPITCKACLKFARRWQDQDPGLAALLPLNDNPAIHLAE